MEQESMFLYAAYLNQPSPCKYDDQGREVISYLFDFKRACMRRRHRTGEQYERVQVDFDPLSKQIVYAVAILFTKMDGNVILKGVPRFAFIESEEEEANNKKKEIESGDYKNFAKEKEIFEKCVVIASMITPD